MANFSTLKGHLMPAGRSTHHTATADAVKGDAVTHGDAVEGGVVRERHLAVAHGPIGDIAAGSAHVVIANPGDDSVSVLDSATLTVVDTVAMGGEPTAVAVSEDRAYVSIATGSQDAVSVVDLGTRTVIKTYPVAFAVTALTIGPDGKRVYAGRADQDRVDVAVIDVTAERVGTIEIGRRPAANIDALRVDPTGRRLYVAVTDTSGSQLIVVDTATSSISRVVPIGSPVRDIAYAGGALYVLTSDRAVGGAVHAVDLATMKVTDTVTLGGAPTQLVASPDETRAYVVDYDRVAVVSTLSMDVVDSLKVDGRPSCVAQGVDSSRLYIADYTGGVSVFSVESSIDALYSQFLATDPVALTASRAPRALHVPRVLQPVSA